MEKSKRIQIFISKEIGSVSGLLILPANAKALMVLSHGAGAGMEHPFMEQLAHRLATNKIGTLRFNFPYMEKGSGPPDRPKKIFPTLQAAIKKGMENAKGLMLLAGGKSFGGRMTSLLAVDEELKELKGIVYYGFPLHAPGKPGIARAAHLRNIQIPQLFIQGTRDALAKLDLIKNVCDEIEAGQLLIIEGGDHSFKTLKRSGINQEEVLNKLAFETAKFIDKL